jgi:hypothetical protein
MFVLVVMKFPLVLEHMMNIKEKIKKIGNSSFL